MTIALGGANRRTRYFAVRGHRLNEKHLAGRVISEHCKTEGMLADALTKTSVVARNLLLMFLQEQCWRVVFDEQFLSARKRAILGKDILDPVSEADTHRAREVVKIRIEAAKLRKTGNSGFPPPEAPTTFADIGFQLPANAE